MWAARTPKEAHDTLSQPDVTVTNLKDKEQQLPLILEFDQRVREALGAAKERQGGRRGVGLKLTCQPAVSCV